MFEVERKRCMDGIAKCDEVLKNWDMRGNKKHEKIKVCEYANEVPPDKVARTFKAFNRGIEDGGGKASADYNLVIFHANAKYGFILRLSDMQERENALSLA